MTRKNKGVLMAPESFAQMFAQVSKAALIDALWCASQLGTNETEEEITTKAAREVRIALQNRGDVTSRAINAAAEAPLESDC